MTWLQRTKCILHIKILLLKMRILQKLRLLDV